MQKYSTIRVFDNFIYNNNLVRLLLYTKFWKIIFYIKCVLQEINFWSSHYLSIHIEGEILIKISNRVSRSRCLLIYNGTRVSRESQPVHSSCNFLFMRHGIFFRFPLRATLVNQLNHPSSQNDGTVQSFRRWLCESFACVNRVLLEISITLYVSS